VAIDVGTTVTVTGTGMLGVTAVQVDGTLLSTFPALWQIVSDPTLKFTLALAATLGPIPVELFGASGSALTSIDVVPNAKPTVELLYSDPAFLIQAIGLKLIVGGEPGDIAFAFGSPDLRKTSLYAFADMDLAIGNQNQSLFILATPVTGPAGYTEVAIPFPARRVDSRCTFRTCTSRSRPAMRCPSRDRTCSRAWCSSRRAPIAEGAGRIPAGPPGSLDRGFQSVEDRPIKGRPEPASPEGGIR